MYSSFVFFFLSTFFLLFNMMALVKLCNTVNRIGISLFHTQKKLFVKVINQLESKKKQKICTTQILFENLFCIKHMQTLTFENYQGQIMFHWYMLSLKKTNCFA